MLNPDGTLQDGKLRITCYTHYKASFLILFYYLVIPVVFFWSGYNITLTIAIFIAATILNLPAIFLHVVYWLKNNGDEFEIRSTEILRRKNGKEKHYKNTDIDSIIIYLFPSLYKNSNTFVSSFEGYHYAEVKLKSGKKIFLTSLLAPRIDKEFLRRSGFHIERKKKLFTIMKN